MSSFKVEKCMNRNVSEVGDRFEFSPERFASSIVPNFNGSVPDAARRALSNGTFSFQK
jgi:hypothetical protein